MTILVFSMAASAIGGTQSAIRGCLLIGGIPGTIGICTGWFVVLDNRA